MTSVEIRAGADALTARVDADGQVRIADATFTVDPIGAGLYRVSDGQRQWTVAVAGTSGERWLFVDGAVYQVDVGPAGSGGRRRAGATGHELSSPMPATVVDVLVEPGAHVSRGDTLITLEAMKMELAVRAPRDAVVTAIHCKAGDLVPPGVVLLDLA
jgi:biotin carboxyl carrier protein